MAPLAEARKARHPAHLAADVLARVHEVDELEPALAEHHRALHPGRSGPHHEHRLLGVRRPLEPLRMPAAAVLLPRRGVLRAAEVQPPDRARVTGVAADALAHLVVAALLDLAREERVRDRRPRGPDQVGMAAADDLRHAVGIREAADDDDRLRGRLLGPARPLELVALLVEAR